MVVETLPDVLAQLVSKLKTYQVKGPDMYGPVCVGQLANAFAGKIAKATTSNSDTYFILASFKPEAEYTLFLKKFAAPESVTWFTADGTPPTHIGGTAGALPETTIACR